MSLGIISFSDSKYFDNFRFFFLSLKKINPMPVCLFYSDLNEDQKSWCLSHDMELKKFDPIPLFPNSHKFAPHCKVGWQTLAKPYCFLRSPFDQTFWMDSDMFVVRSLEGLFERLNKGPVFSTETCCGGTYSYNFLDFLPPVIHKFNKGINAGLIGLDSKRDIDQLILYEWLNLINYFEHRETKPKRFNDQICLLYTLEKLDVNQKFFMSPLMSSQYNHSPNPRVKFKGDHLIDEVKQAYDHRLIHRNVHPHCLHFFDKGKMPQLCEKKFEDIVF
jgi:hypothetical protein